MSFSVEVGNSVRIRSGQSGRFQDLLLAQPSQQKPVDIELRVEPSSTPFKIAVEAISFRDDTYRFKGRYGGVAVTGDYSVDEADSANDTGTIFKAEAE